MKRYKIVPIHTRDDSPAYVILDTVFDVCPPEVYFTYSNAVSAERRLNYAYTPTHTTAGIQAGRTLAA